MSLHPQLLTNTSTINPSGIFRLKALFSEQRARESSEPRSRNDWEELAIEWHMMENLAADAKSKSIQSTPGKKMRDSRRIGHKAYRWPMSTVCRFIADETAATAIEYCLIAAGIALGIFVAVAGIEARINSEFMAINSSLK